MLCVYIKIHTLSRSGRFFLADLTIVRWARVCKISFGSVANNHEKKKKKTDTGKRRRRRGRCCVSSVKRPRFKNNIPLASCSQSCPDACRRRTYSFSRGRFFLRYKKMIDWVSIVRQSNRRFSNCMYFVPRSRRHRQKQQQRINVTIPDPDDGDRSTGCFKVRTDGIFFTWHPLRQGNANVFIGHTRPSKLIDTRFSNGLTCHF